MHEADRARTIGGGLGGFPDRSYVSGDEAIQECARPDRVGALCSLCTNPLGSDGMKLTRCLALGAVLSTLALLPYPSGSLAGQTVAARLRLPACFVLSYAGDSAADSIFYASHVGLGPGEELGVVASEGYEGDPLGIWRVFERRGVWVPVEPDSVLLLFYAAPPVAFGDELQGASIAYALAVRGDSLAGRVRLFDRRPWLQVVGRRVPCSSRAPGPN